MTRSNSETEKLVEVDDELKIYYKEAFDDFDWNKNGRITCGVSLEFLFFYHKLKYKPSDANVMFSHPYVQNINPTL